MAEEQKTGLFGLKIRPVQTQKELDALLNTKPKKERIIRRGKFNLDKVYGPGDYIKVGKNIEKDGLLRPTMAETSSLVHAVFFDKLDEKYSSKIKEMMKMRYLWTFTAILYVPNKGAYIQDAPETLDNMLYMEESDLVKKLQRNDKSVRFVPFGYKVEYMTPKELGKNKFVIGLAGREGAEKLAEAAGKHKDNPYLWSFKSVNEHKTRVSTVDSTWNLENGGLIVDGDDHSERVGSAFGIQKNTG